MMTLEDARKGGTPLIDPKAYAGSDYAKTPKEVGYQNESPYIITTDPEYCYSHPMYCESQGKLDLDHVLMRGSRGAMRHMKKSDFAFGVTPKYHWPYQFTVRYLRMLDKHIQGDECTIRLRINRKLQSCIARPLGCLIFSIFAERDDLFGNSISAGLRRIQEEKHLEHDFLNRINRYMAVLMEDGRMFCFNGRTERFHAMKNLCDQVNKCG